MKKLLPAVCAAFYAFGAPAQTVVASDDCESVFYTLNGKYVNLFNTVVGFGFANNFSAKRLDAGDQGSPVLENVTPIDGANSFEILNANTGTGRAFARDFTTALDGLHRVQFRIVFNLSTGVGSQAGFVLSSKMVKVQSDWKDGLRLFIGVTGDGKWKYDNGSGAVSLNDGANPLNNYFALTGNDYLVTVDFNNTASGKLAGDRFGLQIKNMTDHSSSQIAGGVLGGTANAPMAAIDFGSAVIGATPQKMIFDDIVATKNPPSPLPVELSGFTAKASAAAVELRWQTASELDNDRFEIERSADGLHWAMIGAVKGNGTSALKHEYEFTDAAPPTGPAYYRLRQIDYDEHFILSGVVAVYIKNNIPGLLIFPNPAADVVRLSFSGDYPGGTAAVYDLTGKEIRRTPLSDGAYPVGDLPAGAYQAVIIDQFGLAREWARWVKK